MPGPEDELFKMLGIPASAKVFTTISSCAWYG
jgi:hypothetical protein